MKLPEALPALFVALCLLNPALANAESEVPVGWSLSYKDICAFVVNGDPALVSTLVGTICFAGFVGYRMGAKLSPQSTAIVAAPNSENFGTGPEELSRQAFAAGYAATLGEWQKIMSNLEIEGHRFFGAIKNMTPQQFFQQPLQEQVNQLIGFGLVIGVMKARQKTSLQ